MTRSQYQLEQEKILLEDRKKFEESLWTGTLPEDLDNVFRLVFYHIPIFKLPPYQQALEVRSKKQSEYTFSDINIVVGCVLGLDDPNKIIESVASFKNDIEEFDKFIIDAQLCAIEHNYLDDKFKVAQQRKFEAMMSKAPTESKSNLKKIG